MDLVDYGYMKQTWDALGTFIPNEYGRAALMGNWYSESKIVPYVKQGNVAPPWTPSETYTSQVDNGTKSESSFVNDSIGYGYAQWTYYTRKQTLYNMAKSMGMSIGSLEVGIAHAKFELEGGYKSTLDALLNATDVRTASDFVLHHYEGPANQSEDVEKLRASYGEWIYNHFAGSTPDDRTYLTISPTKASMNDGDTLEITVNASGDWSYTVGQYLQVVSKSDTTLTITCDANGASVTNQVIIQLVDDTSYISKVTVTLNGSITPPEEDDTISITPKTKNAVSGQSIKFTVKASGAWSYRLGSGLEFIDKTDSTITVRVRKGTSVQNSVVKVFLTENNSIMARSIITVKGGGTGLVADKMPLIYYLRRNYKNY